LDGKGKEASAGTTTMAEDIFLMPYINYRYSQRARDSRQPKVVVFDQTILDRSIELGAAIKNARLQLTRSRLYNVLVLLDEPITQGAARGMLDRLGLEGQFDAILTYDIIAGSYRTNYDADTILLYIKTELKQGTIEDGNFIILASEDKINSVWQHKAKNILLMVFKPVKREDETDIQLLSAAMAGAIEIVANGGELDSSVRERLNDKIQALLNGKFEVLPTKIDDKKYSQRAKEYRNRLTHP
jgi:hypothetical protein